MAALDKAAPGPVEEGNVGGGTAMVCHAFKGGIGTASRRVPIGDRTYTVGVLVQANHGGRDNLHVVGVPVGKEIPDLLPEINEPAGNPGGGEPGGGSIIIVIATDCPLLPHQLKRLARRAPLGIGLVGGAGSNGSGDLAIAFSTANADASHKSELSRAEFLPNALMTNLFYATIQATEEAIVNALVAAETMVGVQGNKVYALPHHRLVDALIKYNRFAGA
jgi:L-aminopeptidase/D-esterase-like protein